MQIAAKILLRYKHRQLLFKSQPHLIEALAQFRRNELKLETLVERLFCREVAISFESREAACDSRQSSKVRLRSRMPNQRHCPVLL